MRQLPPLNALRTFEAAARHQNLTKAAAELNVTRTAVSQQVKQLEEYLQAKLFERRGSTLTLTPEADYYLPLLTNAFDALSAGTEHFFEKTKKQRLTLRVANSFLNYWLMPRLADFHRLHADISLKVFMTSSGYSSDNN